MKKRSISTRENCTLKKHLASTGLKRKSIARLLRITPASLSRKLRLARFTPAEYHFLMRIPKLTDRWYELMRDELTKKKITSK